MELAFWPHFPTGWWKRCPNSHPPEAPNQTCPAKVSTAAEATLLWEAWNCCCSWVFRTPSQSPTYHQDRHCHMDASAYLPKLLSGPRNGESQFSLVSAISTPTRSAPHGTLTAAALSSWSCRKRRITARRTRAKTSPAHETLTLQSRNHPEMSALFSAACLGLNVPIKRWRAGFSKHHPLPASGPTHFTQPTDKDSYAHTFVPESNKRAQ